MTTTEPEPHGAPVPVPFRQDVQPLGFGDEAAFALQVEDGLFNLLTSAYSDDDGPGDDMDFSRLITSYGPWGAVMNTVAQDHVLDVVLAVVRTAVPAPEWAEDSDDATITLADGQLAIASLYWHAYGRWTLPVLGPWALRASRRGGDRNSTVESTAIGARERWLLQLWPVG